MKPIDDQRIIIYCSFKTGYEQAVLYGVYFARMLKKEICLFSIYGNENEKDAHSSKLKALASTLISDLSDHPISTLLLKGNVADHIVDLGEKYNGVLFVISGIYSRKLFNAFYRSRMPFLFSGTTTSLKNGFQKVVIPIDYRLNSKDASLWGSYMGRFNQSEVRLVLATDSDKEMRMKVRVIEQFIMKFFSQFTFKYTIDKAKHGSWGVQKEVLTTVTPDVSDLIIMPGSSNVSWIDYLMGSADSSRMRKSGGVPVMLINARKELYVLCH